jgi:tRNA modification GTPase
MYQNDDTIAAISSPSANKRVIIRISGTRLSQCIKDICPEISSLDKRGIYQTNVKIDNELVIPCRIYFFKKPHSYTGENLAEIHFYSNPQITETLLKRILENNIRLAQPGEFTSRALLNGKIDIAQAEAVNEIITSSNTLQLQAGEKLLQGNLVKTITKIHTKLINCLSLIEAGLDFSDQQIEFITKEQAVEKIQNLKSELEKLLNENITNEITMELASVGIAGAPNTGKSSLLNALTGSQRSIVHHKQHTTRDVLTCRVKLEHTDCVIFDSPGLLNKPESILEQLSFKAALENLKSSAALIFCVDCTKQNLKDDKDVFEIIKNNISDKTIIPVMTKSDLLNEKKLDEQKNLFRKTFNMDFYTVSSTTASGIENLKTTVNQALIKNTDLPVENASAVALTARHRRVVKEAVESLPQAVDSLKTDNPEIAAMLIRTACEQLAVIENQPIDEKILENIFSSFCIGK